MRFLALLPVALAAAPRQILFSGERSHVIDTSNSTESSAWPRPPVPPIIIDLSDKTIAQILNDSLHSPHHPHDQETNTFELPLHRLAFLLNISDSPELKEKLADGNAKLTFLAPDDAALTPPHHGDPHHGPHGPPHHGPPHHGPPHHDGPHEPPHHKHDHESEPPHHGPPHHGPPHHGPPHHGPRHGPPHEDMEDWSDLLQLDAETSNEVHPFHAEQLLSTLEENEGDDEDEKRKAFRQKVKKIIGYVLRYHLLNEQYGKELIDQATVASDLLDTRIRVEPRRFPVPSVVFNFYAKSTGPIIKAKNGDIVLIGAPLLPPLPVLETLFVFPGVFSTLTSGVQKVGLDISSFHHSHEDEADDQVSPYILTAIEEIVKEHDLSSVRSFTVFAPTNFAFRRLGFKLNAFLFSPFGRRILKAVLAYHVVPDVIFYSDFNINATAVGEREDILPPPLEEHDDLSELHNAGLVRRRHHCHRRGPPKQTWRKWFVSLVYGQEKPEEAVEPPKVKVRSYKLKTALNETILPVDVFESRGGIFPGKGPIKRSIIITAEGRKPGSEVRVVAADAVAFKGAIHVVNSLIRPPMPHHDHDEVVAALWH